MGPADHKGWSHFLGVPGIPGPDAYDAEVVQEGMGSDRIHRFKGVEKEGS